MAKKKNKEFSGEGSMLDRVLSTFKTTTRGTDDLWKPKVFTTGLMPLDAVLYGGYVEGGAVEIYGPFASGKSFLVQIGLMENQKVGGLSILKTSEMDFNLDLFEARGGDAEALLVDGAPTVEGVFSFLSDLCDMQLATPVEERKPIVVGWDSIAMTGTKHLQEQGVDGSRDMTKAGVMSSGSTLMCEKLKRSGVSLLATNQVRDEINTNTTQKWNSHKGAKHTPGGKAFSFLCYQRIELDFLGGMSGSSIMDGDEVIGRWIKVLVTKNRLGPHRGACYFPIYMVEGRDHPQFKGHKTPMGIDFTETLFKFYNDHPLAVYGPDRTPFMRNAGPRKAWTEGMESFLKNTGRDASSFFIREWPDKLEQIPELRKAGFDPTHEVL